MKGLTNYYEGTQHHHYWTGGEEWGKLYWKGKNALRIPARESETKAMGNTGCGCKHNKIIKESSP